MRREIELLIVQLTWPKSQLEQQWFFLLSFCVVYAVHGVFYNEQILFYHFECHIKKLRLMVCSMHIEQLVPMVYVSADVFWQDLITIYAVYLEMIFFLPLFNMVAHKGNAANKKVAGNK